jgi:hypothetical protein
MDHITKDEEENEGEGCLKYNGVACAFTAIPGYNFVFTVAALRYYSRVFLFQNGLCHATKRKAKKILVLSARNTFVETLKNKCVLKNITLVVCKKSSVI